MTPLRVSVAAATVAVLLTLLPSTTLGANEKEDLIDLIKKLAQKSNSEKVSISKSDVESKSYRYHPHHEPAAIDPSQNLNNGLTDAQKQRFVHLWNKYRAAAGASNMNLVVWNDQLARVAQEWSDRCTFKHRDLNNPYGDGYIDPGSVGFSTSTIGENIAAYSDNTNIIPDKPMHDWHHEIHDYDFNSRTCQPGKDCGHYIAMLWSHTTAIGCGFTKCGSVQAGGSSWPGGVMISCNTAPGPDPAKQLFQPGPPCTDCLSGHGYCTHHLCDNTCFGVGSDTCTCNLNCVNGQFNGGDCSCMCNPGSMGTQCDEYCQDLDYQCGSSWPPMFCDANTLAMFGAQYASMHDTIATSCPMLCGKCQAGKKTHDSHRISSSKSSRHHHHHHHHRKSD